MITYYRRTERDKVLKEYSTFSKEMWISVIDPSEEEIERLVEEHKLDIFNVKGGLDEYELPRIEEEDGIFYIYVNIMPANFERELHTLLIILTPDALITISKIEPRFFKKILDNEIEFVTTQKFKNLITILSLINREFERITRRIVKQVQTNREKVNIQVDEKIVADLLHAEDILNTFMTSYHYTNLVYERMMRRLTFFEDDKNLIDDLKIEGEQGADMCRSSLRTIGNMRSYISIISSNRRNHILKILTILTIFIALPAAISGMFGMNVALPLQHSPFAFLIVMGIVIIAWIAIYLYFKKTRIL